jgi:predicted metallopeptidase
MLDYTSEMRKFIADISARCSELSHVQVDRILISFSHARVVGPSGQFAKIAPLRFEGGRDTVTTRRRRYTIPRLEYEGREILYVIYFCMPKFQNLGFREKFITIFHELYHISPLFNGDIRRFPGRYYAHGPSRKAYNEAVGAMVDKYLVEAQNNPLTEFLRVDFTELRRRHGRVAGLKVSQPKPRPTV